MIEVAGTKGVGAEDAHVVPALEGSWVGDRPAAHTPAHLADGIVLVFFEPAVEVGEDGEGVMNPPLQQHRSHHGYTCAGQDALDQVDGAVHTASDSEVSFHVIGEDSGPVKAQQ